MAKAVSVGCKKCGWSFVELDVVKGGEGVVGTVDGAVESFERFYDRELEPQVRRAFILTGSSSSANDLVHDAMIETWRRWATIERPGAYLNRAVLNRCRDRLRT